jgi:uncharacterized protein YxeA
MKSISKKLIALVLLSIIISSYFYKTVQAESSYAIAISNENNETNTIIENSANLDINSEAAILIERKSRKCFI